MTALDLLRALHAHPSLTLHRVGEGLKVLPRVPEEARPTLAHFKPALLRALEGGERVEARARSSPPPGAWPPSWPTPWGWRRPWC